MQDTRKITPTSRWTAEAGDIVLRETQTTRLLFRALLVENAIDREAAVRGTFVYQRKGRNDEWEDYRELTLNQLRAEEWIKLELHSAEILKLYNELGALYRLFEEEGIPADETEYQLADSGLDALLGIDADDFQRLLEDRSNEATDILARLLAWTLAASDPESVLDILEQLDTDDLKVLSGIAGLKVLKECYDIWLDNVNNADEEFWQGVFDEYAFVLSQVFAYPIVIIEDKAYVGGKSISNTGGNIVDFLFQNQISENAILIEIKTPSTSLLGRRYRHNAYSVSSDVSGAIVQVANYRASLVNSYRDLVNEAETGFLAFDPACVVVAGNQSMQLDSLNKRRSFELFRGQLKDVQLITYDEVFGKLEQLISLMEGDETEAEEFLIDDDDIPF